MRSDDFIGMEFDGLSLNGAKARIAELSNSEKFSFVVTPNVDHAIQLSRRSSDDPVRAAYAKAALVLCDSRILGGLARLCGRKLSIVPGSDLTREIFANVLKPGDSVAIVGGDETTLEALRLRFPGIAYTQHIPPMGFIRDTDARDAAARFIEEAGVVYTFLAVGFPQSELLAADVVGRGKAAGVGLCIGASIEFIVGTKQRAPLWMQRSGLEWLFRLLSEPKRLWRRYLVDGPAIFAIVLRWRMSGRGV
ncbi:MAG: WecB/TagA/CpsF family glycosyltransferase [Sphingomonadales bacterium]